MVVAFAECDRSNRRLDVKVTRVPRPVGHADIRKTQQYIDRPKTSGYASLVLRGSAAFSAPSVFQGFQSEVIVSYLLVNPQQDRALINTATFYAGDGARYATFDSLLEAHTAAHAQLHNDLLATVPCIYARLYQ